MKDAKKMMNYREGIDTSKPDILDQFMPLVLAVFLIIAVGIIAVTVRMACVGIIKVSQTLDS